MPDSARLHFRRFTLDDLPHVAELESDPDIMRFTPSRFPLSLTQIETRLRGWVEKDFGELGIWAAELKSGEFVGWFMLLPGDAPELGFMLVKKAWGKGLASEAALALSAFALARHSSVTAVADADNFASIRVLEKAGFRFTGSTTKFDEKLGREVEAKHFVKERI